LRAGKIGGANIIPQVQGQEMMPEFCLSRRAWWWKQNKGLPPWTIETFQAVDAGLVAMVRLSSSWLATLLSLAADVGGVNPAHGPKMVIRFRR